MATKIKFQLSPFADLVARLPQFGPTFHRLQFPSRYLRTSSHSLLFSCRAVSSVPLHMALKTIHRCYQKASKPRPVFKVWQSRTVWSHFARPSFAASNHKSFLQVRKQPVLSVTANKLGVLTPQIFRSWETPGPTLPKSTCNAFQVLVCYMNRM